MPKFEHIEPVLDLDERTYRVVVEAVVGAFGISQKFLERKLVHIHRQNLRRAFGIVERNEIFDVCKT